MKISLEIENYSKKRFGKFFLTIIEFDENGKMSIKGKRWVGNAGMVEIEANVGDIIMYEQVDNRVNSLPSYFQIIIDEEKYYALSLGWDLSYVFKTFKENKNEQ